MAARNPITRLDAPIFKAKVTRKTPPVMVSMAWVASPSLMTLERPFLTSSGVNELLDTFIVSEKSSREPLKSFPFWVEEINFREVFTKYFSSEREPC